MTKDIEGGVRVERIVRLYHATTEKKAKHYRETGYIRKTVRGFTTVQGAMAWAMKVGRTVIYEVEGEAHKLPDHHNRFGEAWWIDANISEFRCVFSATSDAQRPELSGPTAAQFQQEIGTMSEKNEGQEAPTVGSDLSAGLGGDAACVWAEDCDGIWNSCDNGSFCFSEDGPDENGFNYCPYCGKRLAAVYFTDEDA